MSVLTRQLPAQRRQTLVFLDDSRTTAHVHLATEVDVTAVRSDRESARESARESGRTGDTPASYVSYVVKVAGDVIADYDEARAVLSGRLRPALTVADDIGAKVLFDKHVRGERCVLSAVIPAGPDVELGEIHRRIARLRDDPLDAKGGFADVLRLQKLPLPVISFLYRLLMSDPGRRLRRQGTFSVTSVGHEPVRSVLPVITGTLGFGVGRVELTPVVRDGVVVVAPVMTLNMAFDHRVIDGAMAAEILGRIKNRLESWSTP